MPQVKKVAISYPSDKTRDSYFQWLCGLVEVEKPGHSYWILARVLFNKEYFWTVPNDDNRSEDGKKLREEYNRMRHSRDDFSLGPCTMLEMLIGLAIRMEDMLAEPSKGNRTNIWFWEMIRNLDFDQYTDEDYHRLNGDHFVNWILDGLLARTFSRNGKGGLFPLKRSRHDQRDIEIWYQMAEYLDENHSN